MEIITYFDQKIQVPLNMLLKSIIVILRCLVEVYVLSIERIVVVIKFYTY